MSEIIGAAHDASHRLHDVRALLAGAREVLDQINAPAPEFDLPKAVDHLARLMRMADDVVADVHDLLDPHI